MPRFLDNLQAVPLQGGTAIFYRGISTGSSDTTHTVSGLVNGAGKSFLPTASRPLRRPGNRKCSPSTSRISPTAAGRI